jgi:protein-tyrosine phosphatase
MRHIEFERLHNVRDLGGYVTDDGRAVRWGRLYRADALSRLRERDLERFVALGVRTVIDLRYPFEIEALGRVPECEGMAYHNLSVEHQPYDQAALDPSIEPARFFADRYAEVATDGADELRRALEVIAAADSAPVAFHCKTGKDRTGILAALVLALLGVGQDDIVEDYALTNLATDRFIADWHADPGNPPLRWPGYGTAPAEAMRLFLSELEAAHGSVRGYAVDALGLAPEHIANMRASLLTG